MPMQLNRSLTDERNELDVLMEARVFFEPAQPYVKCSGAEAITVSSATSRLPTWQDNADRELGEEVF